jgi:hypothetical protein
VGKGKHHEGVVQEKVILQMVDHQSMVKRSGQYSGGREVGIGQRENRGRS